MRNEILVFALLGVFNCHPTPASHPAISVTAMPETRGDDYALRFEVRNNTDQPLVVIDRFLPWGGNAANWGENPALSIKANDESGHELQKLFPVRELGPDAQTIIAPGSAGSGTLRLSHYFDGVRDIRDRHQSLRIDWTYRLKPIGQRELLFKGTTHVP